MSITTNAISTILVVCGWFLVSAEPPDRLYSNNWQNGYYVSLPVSCFAETTSEWLINFAFKSSPRPAVYPRQSRPWTRRQWSSRVEVPRSDPWDGGAVWSPQDYHQQTSQRPMYLRTEPVSRATEQPTCPRVCNPEEFCKAELFPETSDVELLQVDANQTSISKYDIEHAKAMDKTFKERGFFALGPVLLKALNVDPESRTGMQIRSHFARKYPSWHLQGSVTIPLLKEKNCSMFKLIFGWEKFNQLTIQTTNLVFILL